MLMVHASAAHHYFTDAGADTSAADKSGYNLLHHACLAGDWDWVEWALRTGCPMPQGGTKSLVQALRRGKLGDTAVTVRGIYTIMLFFLMAWEPAAWRGCVTKLPLDYHVYWQSPCCNHACSRYW
jgi:hypothetical protein